MDLMRILSGRLVPLATVVGLIVFTYLRALNGPFLLDDFSSVMPAKIDVFKFSELWRVSLGDGSGLFGRAIPVLTFALNDYFLGGDAYQYKLINLIIHALNFFLVYYFLLLLFSCARQEYKLSSLEIRWLALICAALWALHPMQMSTVMYVVQRMAMLSTTFCLCALIVYLKYRSSIRTKKGVMLWIVSVSLLTLFACLSKENGALTIMYIALLEVLFFPQAIDVVRKKIKTVDRRLLLLVITVVISSVVFTLSKMMSGYSLRDFDLVDRLLTQPVVLVFYLRNMIFPNLNEMSIYQDGYIAISEANVSVVVSVAILAIMLAIAVSLKRRMSYVSFGIGLFFLSHLLESTVLPLELVFEHRNYLSILGVCIAVVLPAWAVLKRYSRRPVVVVAMAVLPILMMAQVTYVRSVEWSSKEALVAAALENKPNSLRARMGKTEQLAAEGRLEELLAHLDASIESHPNHSLFNIQKVMFTGALGRQDAAAFNRAVYSLSQLPLRTTDLIGLNELYRFRSDGRFSWPSMQGVADMFAAAVSNENTRIRPASKAILNHAYTTIVSDLEL